MRASLRPYATAGVVLVGASLIVATPVARSLPDIQMPGVRLTTNDTYVVDSPDHLVGLIVGGSGMPIPQSPVFNGYVPAVDALFMQRILPGAHSVGVFTPEGAEPIFSGVKSLPLGTSMNQDQIMLNDYITQNVDAGNTVGVLGYSQSSMVSSNILSEQQLQHEGVPTDAVKFVLIGDLGNPNGGIDARFDTTYPAFSTPLTAITPPDTPYVTSIYTLEYDGFADFPKYPLNILSDLNAELGFGFVHSNYQYLTPQEVDAAVQLPTTADYVGNTSYYMIPAADDPVAGPTLPLLQPLLLVPGIGKPLADLLQPVLTQIVNLGYDNPANQGWDAGPANVVTGIGLAPSTEQVQTAMNNLGPAVEQGFQAFTNDINAELANPSSMFTSPLFEGATINTSELTKVLSSPTDFSNAFTDALQKIQELQLPETDTFDTFAFTIPTHFMDTFMANLSDGPLGALGLAVGQAIQQSTFVDMVDLFTIVQQLGPALNDFGIDIPYLDQFAAPVFTP